MVAAGHVVLMLDSHRKTLVLMIVTCLKRILFERWSLFPFLHLPSHLLPLLMVLTIDFADSFPDLMLALPPFPSQSAKADL